MEIVRKLVQTLLITFSPSLTQMSLLYENARIAQGECSNARWPLTRFCFCVLRARCWPCVDVLDSDSETLSDSVGVNENSFKVYS